jgi:PE family
MSFVIAAPEMMTAAAADLATIGSNVSAAHMAAAAPTLAVLPAAADEVSASIAHLFPEQAQAFHALAGNAAAFHDQFVATLKTSGGFYSATEAAAAASLQPAAASLAPAAGPLNLVSQLLADPELIPVVLFVLGFIGFAAIYIVVFNWLGKLGLLGGV